MGNYIATIAGASPVARFTVKREAFAAAAAFLAKSIVEKRNTIPILSNILIDVGADCVTLTGTDLDIETSHVVPARVDSIGSRFTVAAAALADIVKAAGKGALLTLSYDPSTGRATVEHGAARNGLPTLPADDFPALAHRGMPDAFEMQAADLAHDLARLKPFASRSEARYYLMGIEFAADADSLTMTASDGDTLARIIRPAPDGAQGLASCVLPRKAAEIVAKLAKAAAGAVSIQMTAQRARFVIGGATVTAKMTDGTYPDVSRALVRLQDAQRLAFYDLEPDLSPTVVEAFRKALGVAPDVHVGDNAYGFTSAAAPEFVGMVALDARETAGRATYGHDTRGVLDFMAGLADRRGFDVAPLLAAAANAAHDGGFPPAGVTLSTRRGIVLGATWGHVTLEAVSAGDRIGKRPATAQEIDAYCEDMGEGMRGMVTREGVDIIADRAMPAQYADGAFSIAMPRDRAEAVCSDVRIEIDGTTYPLRATVGANGITSAIELSADAVRRLAGPVDPSTHRAIAPAAFHCGEKLAAGWIMPKAPKIAAGAALRMSAREMADYAAACAPVFAGEPVTIADVLESTPDYVAPALPVAANDTDAPTVAQDVAETVAGVIAPEVAQDAPAPAVAPLAASPDVTALEARLAALEGIVARLARPTSRQRTERERAAIVRAWRMRGGARAARAAADAVYASIVADRDELARRNAALLGRIGETEAFAEKRTAQAREAVRLSTSYHAASLAADARAGRMVRAAARHRTTARRAADDLRASQAEARALARRLEGHGVTSRQRVPLASAMTPTDSGAVAALAA